MGKISTSSFQAKKEKKLKSEKKERNEKHGKLFLYKGNKKRTFSISHTRIIFFLQKNKNDEKK